MIRLCKGFSCWVTFVWMLFAWLMCMTEMAFDIWHDTGSFVLPIRQMYESWRLRAVQGLLLCQWLVWKEAERSKECLQTNITSAGDPILGTPSFSLKQEISILAPVCLLLVSPEDAHRPGVEQSGNMGGESRDVITHIKGVVLLTDKRLLIFQLSSEINILYLSPTTSQFAITME